MHNARRGGPGFGVKTVSKELIPSVKPEAKTRTSIKQRTEGDKTAQSDGEKKLGGWSMFFVFYKSCANRTKIHVIHSFEKKIELNNTMIIQ